MSLKKRENRKRERRNYYICENNPEKCDYISWNKPGTENKQKKTTRKRASTKKTKSR